MSVTQWQDLSSREKPFCFVLKKAEESDAKKQGKKTCALSEQVPQSSMLIVGCVLDA